MKKLYIVSGVPGSGKTLQAKLLAEALDGKMLSWGTIIRRKGFLDTHTLAGAYLQGDNSVAGRIFLDQLKKLILDNEGSENFVIDGFPKFELESQALLEFCNQNNVAIEALVQINVSLATIKRRMPNSLNLEKEYYDYIQDVARALAILKPVSRSFFTINGDSDKHFVFAELLFKLNSGVKLGHGVYEKKAESLVPTKFGEFRIAAYQSKVNFDVHLAIIKGNVAGKKGIVVRVHSSCMTGDILGSLKCDCGSQLHSALEFININGEGVVLYLLQEGRGINIINKLLAYDLQRNGRDTVQANEELGLPSEMREYGLVKDILDDLGIVSIKLMTNNPDKIKKLVAVGVNVEDRLAIEIKPTADNIDYLHTKVSKMDHSISYFKS